MTTTLSAKGQIVIPNEMRERKGLCPGDELQIDETADAIIIHKKRRREGLAVHLLKLKGTRLRIPKVRGNFRPEAF